MWLVSILAIISLMISILFLIDVLSDEWKYKDNEIKRKKWIEENPTLTVSQENEQYLEGFKERYPDLLPYDKDNIPKCLTMSDAGLNNNYEPQK